MKNLPMRKVYRIGYSGRLPPPSLKMLSCSFAYRANTECVTRIRNTGVTAHLSRTLKVP